jgi:hypothetical protein
MDAMLVEQGTDAGEGEIVAAERGAFITGNKCSGVEAGAAIAAHLVHREPDECLDSGEIDRAVFGGIAIVEIHECLAGIIRNSRQGSGGGLLVAKANTKSRTAAIAANRFRVQTGHRPLRRQRASGGDC